MNSMQLKICSLSKKISIALIIGFAFSVATMLFVIAGFFVPVFNSSFLNPITISINIPGLESISTSPNLYAVLTAMLVKSLIKSAHIFILYLIFLNISRSAKPFDKKHTAKIKLLALLQIIPSVLNITDYTLQNLEAHGALSLQIDLSGIAFGVLIYLTALIYDYGCELQQQSDETL